MQLPALADVFAARRRLEGVIRRTPVLQNHVLDDIGGASFYFKAEALQVTGAYKVRGAYNKVATLTPEEKGRGVVTASAGNAAMGVAYAARAHGVRATVCMFEGAVPEKVAAVKALGATVIQTGLKTGGDALDLAAAMARDEGLTYCHPFDDFHVIAGQGTLAWEMLEDCPPLDCVYFPTSGGGLIAGGLIALKALSPRTQVFGVQPEAATGIIDSLKAGEAVRAASVKTVADALTAPGPGKLNFEIIRRHADDVFTVSDDEILAAMGLTLRHLKVVVEPGAAAALAGALKDGRARGRRVGVVLSGGNASPALAARVLQP